MAEDAKSLTANWAILQAIGNEIVLLAKMAKENSSVFQLIEIHIALGDAVNRADVVHQRMKKKGFTANP